MASATQDEKIAPTAHYTAYVWHRLGFPNASLFVTPLGRAMFWGFRFAGEGLLTWAPFAPSMTQYLEYRHRAFESVVEDTRPDVVVELGAGLSRRGVTWASRGVRYVEVDLPHMVRAKQAILAERSDRALRESIRGRLEHVSLDILGDGFAEELGALLEGAERPVVMTEGVLTYFTPENRRRLARSVATALAGRGAFVGEMRVKHAGATGQALGVLRGSIRLVTGGRGAGADEPSHEVARQAFLDAGFASVEAVEPSRWPHLARFPLPARVWVSRGLSATAG
ncbi:MAG: class I SAM-dependent methyltransferase [Sandaracinaceae bacterium]|nr:class I SAM-dependent methyltransferase [Sandaracinaceae bacterium]